jgi:Leucine-rich repeat (LRR) protein
VTRLRQLSLEGNGELTFVEVRNALKDLDVSSLEDLNIAWCNLSDVAGIFRRDDFKKLSRLVLSHNSIQKVAHGAFYYLISLTELDVQFNKLNSVGDLSALARLERLILSHNVINTLSETSFEGLQNLRHLDLSFNELQELTDGPLENLWELQELDVSSNRLEVIQIETGLENLRHLRLVSNRLTDARFIQRLPRLQTLDLSDNRITALEQYCVVQSLRLANFSGNRIHSIHWSAFHGASVRTLDLSHNHLQMVGTWQWPSKLVNLHLDSNLIQNVSTEGFKGLKDLELLHLADNQLTHLPRSLPDDAANIGDLDLSGNPLGDYMLSLGSGGGGRMLVRLRGLQFLSLSRTQLQRIPTDVFAQFTYSPLQRVDFSQNAIAELPASRTFRALTHLKHLDLSQNRISYVDPDIFEYMPALRHIDLTYNPWQCSCDLLPFLRWAFAPVRWAFVPDRDTLTLANLGQAGVYVCDSPVSMRGLNLDGFVTSGTVQGLEQCAEREGGDDVSGGGGGGGHYRSPWSFRGAGAPSTALVVGGGFLVFLAVALLTGAICVCACSSKARQRRDGDSDPTHSKYLSIRDQHASNQTTPAHAPAQNKAQIVWL